MRKPEIDNVEVDMVPMIDIISLLLMFLIVVGGTAETASSVKMKLPRASEAKVALRDEGQVVVQLAKNDSGHYQAVVNNRQYEMNKSEGSLKDYLDRTLEFAIQKHMAKRNADSTVDWPAKLRIPEDCPMQEVEKVIGVLASVGMVNVRYAAQNAPLN